jgi:hypothetical protein
MVSAISSSPNRRSFLAAAAAGVVSSKLQAGTDDIVIRPFHIDVSDDALADLRRRIAATK